MKLLSSKIFVGYLLIIILLTSLILWFSFRTIRSHYIDTARKELVHTNSILIQLVSPYLIKHDYNSLKTFINKTGKEINTRITIIASDGKVLADSKFDAKMMENHKNRPEIKSAIQGDSGQSLRYSTTLNNEMLYVAHRIESGGKLIGVSRVSFFLSDIDMLTNRLTSEILQIAVIVVFISLIGVLVFSRSISSPINQLSQASRKVAKGNFDIKVSKRGHDEITELFHNFNNMTTRLKELFNQVITQKDEYTTLIASIQEGLIVIDTDGVILMANQSFNEIIHEDDIIGKNFRNVLKDTVFHEIFTKTISGKKSITIETEFEHKYILCSSNLIESKNEIVMLLHDITEIKKVEIIKKDFVVNVSHELKTPLTAIKGFIETLEDDTEDETHIHYIDIIKRHTNRLINIVQDLLMLSELEEVTTKLMFSKVDLSIIFENVMKIFEQRINNKNLYLKLNIDSDFPKIKIDTFKMEQVFVNLIDNAIKYTDEGGISIDITNMGDNARIVIKDTGIGLNKEDKERIFERFYIVDKSRSRKSGGSGLGLSICKHIVLQHNGTIEVESEVGDGTAFIINLPFKQS